MSRRQPHFCSLFAPKLSHFYSKIIGYRCIFMFWRNFVCPSNRRFEANCQRGTVSTLEFRFETKLPTWINTIESFCRKLFICSLFDAKMVVSRFIIEFWRTGVSVDNRKFCSIFVAKSEPKGHVENHFFCSLFAPKFSHFYSKMVGSRCIFMSYLFRCRK